MTKHQQRRKCTRSWDFQMRCPAPLAAQASDIIKDRFIEFMKLRREDDVKELKTLIDDVKVESKQTAVEENRVAGYSGTITIIHRTSIDYVSFPRLRELLMERLGLTKQNFELSEVKAPKQEKVAAAAPVPGIPVVPAPVAEIPAVAAIMAEELKTPPKPQPAPIPDVPAMITEPPHTPAPPPKPVKRKIVKTTKANLAAAAIVPVELPQTPAPTPEPPAVRPIPVFAWAPAHIPNAEAAATQEVKRFAFGK